MGGFTAPKTSKMELFVTIVNCFQYLTIITKSYILEGILEMLKGSYIRLCC